MDWIRAWTRKSFCDGCAVRGARLRCTLCRYDRPDMKTRIQKWGNSLTVRNGKLIVVPLRQSRLTLEELVRQITPENRHEAVEAGEAVGNEIW